MKSKIIKRIAGITSIGLVGTIVVGAIMNIAMPVKAEGTLFGIETLIQEVQNREVPYRILELVPDEKTSEIGYYIPEYEPALSTRQAGSGEWTGWEEGMKQFRTAEERNAYMEELNTSLQEFLTIRGFEGNNAPVTYLGYEESEEPAEGYTELVFEDQVLKGYFQPYSGAEGVTRYELDFRYAGNYYESEFAGQLSTQYYYVQEAIQVTTAMFDSLTDDAVLYRFVSQVGADRFEKAGAWGELKSIFEDSPEDGDMIEDETPEEDTYVDGEDETVEDDMEEEGKEEEGTDVEDVVEEERIPVINEAIVSGGDILTSSAGGSISGGDAGINPEIPESEVPESEVPESESSEPEMIEPESPNPEGANGEETESDESESDESEPEESEPDEGEPTEFYLVNIQPWKQDIIPDYPALYAVETITRSDSGSFEFFIDENGFDYSFSTEAIYYKGGFVNNEWFHINVLNMQPGQADSFPMEVVTLTVSELNAMGELPAYDMLYINSGMQSFPDSEITQNYSGPSASGEDSYPGNDISNDKRTSLFEDVISKAKPCIVDAAILYTTNSDGTIEINESLKNTDIFRLAAMLTQTSPQKYAKEANEDIDQLLDGMVEDKDRNFVVEQTYSFYAPSVLIGPDFGTYNIYKDGADVKGAAEGFGAVLGEIVSENLNREADATDDYNPLPTDVSQSTAVRHIMNYSNRRQIEVKKSIRVLEIQPAKSDENSYDLTEEEIKSWAPKVEEVQIERMTTAEFIGKIEDINEVYDLVYIGTDTDTLNTITRAEVPTEPTALKNGDFENGLNGWTYSNNASTTMDNIKSGARALMLPRGTIEQVFEAEPGQKYKLSAYGKVGMGNSRATLGIDFRSNRTNNIGKTEELEFTSNSYEYKSTTFTATAETNYLHIYAWSQDNYTYLDDIKVEKLLESDTKESTVFNDSSMDGLIYFHTGDLRYASIELAGQLDTEFYEGNRDKHLYYYNPVRYGGNDITKDKKDELLSFLNASYAIIVSDEFFQSSASVFRGDNYSGYHVDLKPGGYRSEELKKMGIGDSSIRSIKVADGYSVKLYPADDFAGNPVELKSDLAALGSITVNSLKIEKIEGANTTRQISEIHIDNSSYMYEFIAEAMKMNNFYSRSDMEDSPQLFEFYLNRPKVQLVGVTANGTPQQGESDIINLYPGANGKYMLEYQFNIQNEGAASANTRYRCEFFIDINADGKYSDGEMLEDITITENGKAVSYDNLYAGRQYVLTRNVPDGYKGVLPWKIQISHINNPHIHNGIIGYTKLLGLETEKVKVLQICRDKLIDFADQNWFGNNEELFNLEERIETTGDIYNVLINGGRFDGEYYEGIKQDFEIDVDFRTISQFEDQIEKEEINLDDYNMLILGFSDVYGDLTPENAAAIVDFIARGKSVLFAHDTLYYFNYEKGKVGLPDRNNTSRTASSTMFHDTVNLSKVMRTVVGMDRYGITSLPLLREGKDLYEKSDVDNLLKQNKEIAYVPRSNRTKTYGLTQGYTYSIINSKDVPASGDKPDYHDTLRSFTPQQTGLSEGFYNNYRNLDYGAVYYDGNNSDNGEIVYSSHTGVVSDLWVTKVNDGQITEYPYKLKDEFQVSPTHGQYYQLDFLADDDGDGQRDLVVWYCLGYKANADGTNRRETIYSMSPNDVANNYYIYNKGNVTYTGVGHSGNTTTVEEAKLFINTMIASYNSGIKNPTISILSDGTGDAKEISSVNIYHDEMNNVYFDDSEITNSDQVGKKKLYFSVNDSNLVKGTRNIAVNCYYESDGADAEEIIYEGNPVKVKSLPMEVYDASTNEIVANTSELKSGAIYYILFDESVLSDFEIRASVYFEAQSIITKKSTINDEKYTIQTDKVYSRFDYTKVRLFHLE